MKHLTALLLNDFEVHAVGCADIKKTVAKGKVQNRFNFKAESEHDAVLFLYDDQIAEAIPDQYPDQEAAIASYANGIRFFPCCQLQWGSIPNTAKASPADRDVKAAVQRGRQAKQEQQPPAANGAKLSRDQKTQLATVIVTAAASVMDQLDGVGLAGVDPAVAAQVVSQWLHHLPVDRARWPEALPTPNRSDWR